MTIPHGDRSGVVIEPMLTDQWFVDAETLAGPAIEAVESGRIRFVPKHWEHTLFRVDEEHPALVYLAPDLVGPPDPGLVRTGRHVLRRDDGKGSPRGGPGSLRRGRGAVPGHRRSRYLVLLRAVAVFHARLAGKDGGARTLLPDQRAGDRVRHYLLLGRADGDDGSPLPGRDSLRDRLHPRPGARCARAENVEEQGQRPRSAGADRGIRRGCAALHADGACRPRARHKAFPRPDRGLPELRYQDLERLPLRANERLRARGDIRARGRFR